MIKHDWTEMSKLSGLAMRATCFLSEEVKVIKPTCDKYDDILPIAANEYICYKLIQLLIEKGVTARIAEVTLEAKADNNLGYNVALIEDLGSHFRISRFNEYDYTFPDWLYWFDRWVGRLDASGDTNLLCVNEEIIPVDFAMSFHWACGFPTYWHSVDHFDIKSNPQIKEASSDRVKEIIQSITDQEIKEILFNGELDDFIPYMVRVTYYTGLCYRRDHLC